MTVKKVKGDYGCGQTVKRKRRIKAESPPKGGGRLHRYHTGLSPEEIAKAMRKW